jgi:hypothetical protein
MSCGTLSELSITTEGTSIYERTMLFLSWSKFNAYEESVLTQDSLSLPLGTDECVCLCRKVVERSTKTRQPQL